MFLNVDISGARIPSHSIIDPDTVTAGNGIFCCGNTVGTWLYPNGSTIPSRGNLLIGVSRALCIELQLEGGSQYSHISARDEGVYTCHTEDTSGSIQMLYVGIYTAQSYENSGE